MEGFGDSDGPHKINMAMDNLWQDDSIIATVDRHAARQPDRPFLITETSSGPVVLTYRELQASARSWAEIYAARGVSRGDSVALMFTSHPAQAGAFLGAMMRGAIPFLLPSLSAKQDPELFWSAQLATIDSANTRLILTDKSNAQSLTIHSGGFDDRVMDVSAISLDLASPESDVAIRRTDIAFLQHSSGTTGAKKGVMLTHDMVLNFVNALGTALQVEDTDIIASWLPLYHDMGLIGCLVLPMLLGITVVHISPFDWVTRPSVLFEIIERYRATICWQPNFAFHHLMRTVPRDKSWDLSSMRAFIDCSEPCKPDTLASYRKRFAVCGLRPEALQVSYGMAENVFIATQTQINAVPRVIDADLKAFDSGQIMPPRSGFPSLSFVSTGPAIPRTTVRIVDGGDNALPERHVGQILVSSPYLFTGYHRSSVAIEKLVDGWYRTGDFGFIDEGEVFVCGRRDELLIINGRNVYAHDLEFSVNRSTAVKPGRCVAIGPYNPRTGSQSLIIIAEIEETVDTIRRSLSSAIRDVIHSEFGLITYDVWITDIGWLLKTTSGKIARGANEARYVKERWPNT